MRAGLDGTGSWYAGSRLGGSEGGVEAVSRRRVARGPCLRMRLRCESASVSSPDCLSHLKGVR